MIPFSHEEGQQLVKVARDSVERLFNDLDPGPQYSVQSMVQAGVFVSIHDFSAGRKILRGCVGFPLPKGEFYSSLEEAAVSAATKDPRFKPISEGELDKVIFEVSVLNPPELITVVKPAEYLDMVSIGVDGLILRWRDYSSLLLPQVASEYDWTVDQYLKNLCCKAGLPEDMWMNCDVKIYKFSCIIYRESKPRGLVYRVDDRLSE
jgi:uncharacterized protein